MTDDLHEAAADDRIAFVRPVDGARRLRTVIGVCLDESGSMGEGGKRQAAIDAFNAFLADQATETADDCALALWKFAQRSLKVHGPLPINHVPHLTASSYTPGGGTALCDAVAEVVAELDREGVTADRIVVAILTDGEENSSRETTTEQVAELCRAREADGRWTFVYLSAAPDAWGQAAALGMHAGNMVQMAPLAAGYAEGGSVFSSLLRDYRQSSGTATMAFSGTAHGLDLRPTAAAPVVIIPGHVTDVYVTSVSAQPPIQPPTDTPDDQS